MLFGHQNDANQPQPQAAEQPEPGFLGPQDQVAQTVAPQASATQDAPAPQDPASGVNPLAVDPATGVSLPTVPQNTSDPVADTPAETTAPADEVQPSVLNQPVTPDVSDPGTLAASAASEPTSAPETQMESTLPSSGSPFSASTATSDPAPAAPVLDQVDEDHAAAAIAQELDTPGEANSTMLTQEPAVPEAPVADIPADPQPVAPVFDAPVATSAPAAAPAQNNNPLLDLKQQAIAQLSPLVSQLDQSPEDKFRTTMMLLQSTDNPALLHDAYTAAQAINDEKVRAQALLDVVNEINYFTQQQDAQAS